MSLRDNSTDSDSEDLPDISHYLEKPKIIGPISDGDIVFARYRKLYWPALVRSVYPKQKKASVWFCDQPGKTFKLPLKYICSLSDRDRRAQIEEDIRDAGCGYLEAFDRLTTHALRYVRRKEEGYKDDPLKFFDQTYPYFCVETFLKKNPNADPSKFVIPPLYFATKCKNGPKGRVSKDDSGDSEVVSIDSEEETLEIETADSEKEETCDLWKISGQSKTENIDKIVEFIKSGKANQYLQDVLSKTVSSEFYSVFEKAAKYGRKDFSSVSFSGPIEDINSVSELTCYLLSFFDDVTTVCNAAKLHKSITPDFPFDNKTNVAHYVASVWLPESIVYAISKIQNISLTEATQLYFPIKTGEINFTATDDALAQNIDLSGSSDSSRKISESKIIANNMLKSKSEGAKHSLTSEYFPLKKLYKHLGTFDITEDSNIQTVYNAPGVENSKSSEVLSSYIDNTSEHNSNNTKVMPHNYKAIKNKGNKEFVEECKIDLNGNKLSQQISKENKTPSKSNSNTESKVNIVSASISSGTDNSVEGYQSDETLKISSGLCDIVSPRRSPRVKNPSGNKFKRVDNDQCDKNLETSSSKCKILPSKRFPKRGKKK